MKYEEAIEYMDALKSYGIVPGLDNIRQLCERLGNPQKELQFIHIAGTNGKGSVSAFVSAVLKSAGYRTGRYISPVIFEYCERIQINERNISKKDLGAYTQRLKEICTQMTEDGFAHPTPFEIETAMAFLYFKEKQCDIVVLETGMGGSQDATNVVQNVEVAVITPVSMDHMKFLGKTLSEIGANKAGIIKAGCEVVTAVQKPEVMKEIEGAAARYGCPIMTADETRARRVKSSLKGTTFEYEEQEPFAVSLLSLYQVQNAVTAIEAIRALCRKGWRINDRQLRQGLFQARWPGRFQLISKKPLFFADGAHNEDGAEKLIQSIRFYFTNKRIIYIMGVLKDKEYEKIIALTAPLADQIITLTPPENERAMNGLELARAVQEYHPNVTAADSVEEAVELSLLLADKNDVIIAFGSLSYLGRLIRCAENRTGSRKQ